MIFSVEETEGNPIIKEGERERFITHVNKMPAVTKEGKVYYASRIVWEFYHHTTPKNVFHIDGNPENYRIDNLSDICNRKVNNEKFKQCIVCGKNSRQDICTKCKKKKEIKERNLKRYTKLKHNIKMYREYISPDRYEILSQVCQGNSMADIARKYNYSRERIRQLVEIYSNKDKINNLFTEEFAHEYSVNQMIEAGIYPDRARRLSNGNSKLRVWEKINLNKKYG